MKRNLGGERSGSYWSDESYSYDDFYNRILDPDSMPIGTRLSVILSEMNSTQPSLDDFKRSPNHTKEEIWQCKDELRSKERKIGRQDSYEDEFTWGGEATLAYILNTPQFLNSAENFAHLASKYDDLCHGTDIVFGLKNPNYEKNNANTSASINAGPQANADAGAEAERQASVSASKDDSGVSNGSQLHTLNHENKFIAYSIDIATGTNPSNIHEKFQNSLLSRDGRAPLTAKVVCCAHAGEKWQEEETPHFVLGVSPAGIQKTAKKININGRHFLQGRDKDPETDFKLLSEIYDQTSLQLMMLKSDPELYKNQSLKNKILTINRASSSQIYEILGLKKSQNADEIATFKKKYLDYRKKYSAEDATYKNIMLESGRIWKSLVKPKQPNPVHS